jgi:phosphinothricin acetyltransferase
MRETDAAAVLRIYGEGIETGHATFEIETPAWEKWDSGHLEACRLVAEEDGEVLGWAALAPASSRPVYAGVTEVSVYVADAGRGRGLGRRLLQALIEASEAAGIWTLQAGIFPENEASIRLHQAQGFRVLGTRCRVGRMTYGPFQGRWRDVVLMERRSIRAGLD